VNTFEKLAREHIAAKLRRHQLRQAIEGLDCEWVGTETGNEDWDYTLGVCLQEHGAPNIGEEVCEVCDANRHLVDDLEQARADCKRLGAAVLREYRRST
jgi:hypothetical protein